MYVESMYRVKIDDLRPVVESWSTQQYRIQVGAGDNDQRTPSAGRLRAGWLCDFNYLLY